MPAPASEKPGGTAYRPDIDGLRAVAVVSVVLCHAFPSAVSGGFVGVDVFFVISGYLISRIIYGEQAAGRFSLMDFYGRRVRRIFPALAATLAATFGYGLVVLLPTELAQLGKHVAGGAGFLSNIVLWGEAGYFDVTATAKPLMHLWSLGVEEQFYALWPAILWLAHGRRPGTLRVALLLVLLSFAANLHLAEAEADAAGGYLLPFPRFWELMLGAVLAWWSLHPPARFQAVVDALPGGARPWAAAASLLGLALIAGSVFAIDAAVRYPGWAALVPTLGAVLLIAAGPSAPVNRVILAHPVAVFLGLISYPLYLWHWPLLSYAHVLRLGRPPTPLMAAGLVALAVLLAWLTYRWLERPVRFGKRQRGTSAGLLAVMGLLGGIGLASWTMEGFAFRHPDLPEVNVTKINQAIGDGVFQPTRSMAVTDRGGILLAEIGSGHDAVLFTGDSLLFHYAPRVEALFGQGMLTSRAHFVVGASCAPFPGIIQSGRFAHCRDMPQFAADLAAARDVGTVVIGASWAGYRGERMLVEREGRRMPLDSPEALDAMFANLEEYVRRMTAAGRTVHLVLSMPTSGRFDPRDMIARSLTGFRVDPGGLQGVPVDDLVAGKREIDQRLAAIAARTGAGIIDPLPDVCGPGPLCSPFFGDGEPKFADTMHLRPVFVRDNVTAFDRILTHAARPHASEAGSGSAPRPGSGG